MRRAHQRLLRCRSHSHPSIFRAARKGRCKGVARAAILCYKAAEQYRVEAATARDLNTARRLYQLVMRNGARSLRFQARERLLLMLFQMGHTPSSSPVVRQQLSAGGFVAHLSPIVMRYPHSAAATPTIPPSVAPPRPAVAAIDGALPAAMLAQLCTAFGPSSPFWSEHGYACGAFASPFFSYVHRLDSAPR